MTQDEMRDKLVAEAQQVRPRAYAPYSNYQVGAALLTADGEIFTGINVENASYGLTNCAERTAVFSMITHATSTAIKGIAICTQNAGSPCGACRQVLVEFAPHDIPVWLCDPDGNVQTFTLYELLPAHFGPNSLEN